MDLKKIQALERRLLDSKENLNDLLPLRKLCSSEDKATAFAASKCTHNVFVNYAEKGLFKLCETEASSNAKKQKVSEANLKVGTWLRKQYIIFVDTLLKDHFSRQDVALQINSLEILFDLEKKCALLTKSPFMNVIYPEIIKTIVYSDDFNADVLAYLTDNMLCYEDVRLSTLKLMKRYIKEFSKTKNKESSKTFIENSFIILKSIQMPKKDVGLSDNNFVPHVNKKSSKDVDPSLPSKKRKLAESSASLQDHYTAFQDAWMEFLKIKNLPNRIHSLTLSILDSEIIPYFSLPAVLLDFLTFCYDLGGEIALLALNSLFVLITQYNLDYPEFYPKLYELLEPKIFNSDFFPRFIKLFQLFMKSPLLPGYMVDAFIKKIARLCLYLEPQYIIVLLPIINNMMIFHPTSQELVHRAALNEKLVLRLNAEEAVQSDPYNPDEKDPHKSNASQSSLWEIVALMYHYLPRVAALAKNFKNQLSRTTLIVDDYLDYSYGKVFNDEMNRKVKKGVPLAFQEPQRLFNPDDFPGFTF
eukprot:TRINITY_DN5225_c0_g1_i2.p1 TRINITY_DN5225_c0_g1~~TRINITY_DN5225_c0_g1_i2.p1  ORF type:complete len:529 (+),score=74.88 TRINITY_DN5225_c0_g1_i2:203-1789(+)